MADSRPTRRSTGTKAGRPGSRSTGTPTPLQVRFCEEYVIDLNGKQAAIRAGYKPGAAVLAAMENLRNPALQEILQNLKDERSRRTEVTADRVLLEIARLAFNDPRKAFNRETEQILPISQWPDEVAAAISSIKVTEQKTEDGLIVELKEVKFWDKNKPLDMAAKHLGMYEADNKQKIEEFTKADAERLDYLLGIAKP